MEGKDTFSLKFGNHLRKLRKDRGLSLRELAYDIDSAKSTLSALENGHVTPNIYFILRICEGLDMSVSEFFKDFD